MSLHANIVPKTERYGNKEQSSSRIFKETNIGKIENRFICTRCENRFVVFVLSGVRGWYEKMENNPI